MIRSILIALAFAVTAASGLSEAKTVVRDALDEALNVLRSTDNRQARMKQLTALASELFAWRDMAQSALGPTWRELEDDERKHFASLFEDLVAAQYRDTLGQFQGDEEVEVKSPKRNGNLVEVPTTVFTHSNEQVPVSYFLRDGPQGWRVHDFSVEGVSMVNHYRSSYRKYLVNKSFDQLVKQLERKQREVATSR